MAARVFELAFLFSIEKIQTIVLNNCMNIFSFCQVFFAQVFTEALFPELF